MLLMTRMPMIIMTKTKTLFCKVIHIYNRHADLVEQLRLPGMCSCFGWDKVIFPSWMVDIIANDIGGGFILVIMVMLMS